MIKSIFIAALLFLPALGLADKPLSKKQQNAQYQKLIERSGAKVSHADDYVMVGIAGEDTQVAEWSFFTKVGHPADPGIVHARYIIEDGNGRMESIGIHGPDEDAFNEFHQSVDQLMLTRLKQPVANSASSAGDISFHAAGDNAYIVELVSPENIGEIAAHQTIRNAAMAKCGSKTAELGRYRFLGNENLSDSTDNAATSFRMTQELLCTGSPSNRSAPTRAMTDQEKKDLEQQARALTDTYLDHLAKMDFEAAYSLLSTTLKSGESFPQWEEIRAQRNIQPGELVRGENWGVTIYIDPPSMPAKGIFVAVDFDREYTEIPIYCGYLVWYVDAGELKLTREDIGRIDLDLFGKMNAKELAAAKSKFRCKPVPDAAQVTR